MTGRYYRKSADRDSVPRNRVSSLEDLDQSLAARYPGTVEALRPSMSLAKVASALALLYNSGKRHGRTFDPLFESMGSDLAVVPWRVDLGLDESLQSVILALLGTGMEMAAVTATVQNFVWDLVTEVARQASRATASNYATALAEEYRHVVSKSAASQGLSPQILAALRLTSAAGVQASQPAAGPGGALNQSDGLMTRAGWQLGRFAGAPGAGWDSWHDNRTRQVEQEQKDHVSVPGVGKVESTTKTKVVTGPQGTP